MEVVHVVAGFTQLAGIAAVVCMWVACAQVAEGTQALSSKSDPSFTLIFYHPPLMTMGMIYFVGFGAIAFRMFPGLDKENAKYIHAILHTMGIVSVCVGFSFVAVNLQKHFQDLHGIVGLIAVLLFLIQWLWSLPAFFCASEDFREQTIILHVGLGLAVLFFGLAATLIASGAVSYGASIAKATGIFLDLMKASTVLYVVFFIFVVIVITLSDFRRSEGGWW